MAINFPNSPTDGQVFNVSPGVSFVARSGLWRPAPLKTALPKNYIVNPSMQVSQEGNISPNVSGNYPADMWLCSFSGFPTVDQARVAGTQPLFYPFYISFATTARASLAAADYVMWRQGIEGQRIAELQWGTPNAKQIVVRFTCNCAPGGTYALSIRNAPVTRSYIAQFTAAPGEQEFIIAIPGDTGGTWANDNTVGLHISFCPASGATYLTAPNAWQAGNFLAFTGMANIAAAGAGTFNIGRVGLYLDPYKTGVAPPFEVPDYGAEIRRCQRYWYRGYGFQTIVANATSAPRGGMRHPVPMRATPAGSIVGTPRVYEGSASSIVTALGTACNPYAAEFDLTCGAGGLTGGRAGSMYYQDDNQYIAMNARL
jgi:hypothetical protein